MNKPKEKAKINDTRLLGYWNDKKTPVYDITSAHGFNQMIGYVKHINAECGTVLYRGQAVLHEKLIPSILHGNPDDKETQERESLLEKYTNNILDDAKMNDLLHFDQDTQNRLFYKRYVTESMLQHYGFRTHFQDFVDNHWTALWFGLYEFQKENMDSSGGHPNHYYCYYKKREAKYSDKRKKPDCLILKEPELKPLPNQPELHDTSLPADYSLDMLQSSKLKKQISRIENEHKQQQAIQAAYRKILRDKERSNHLRIENWKNECKRIQSENENTIKQYHIDQESDIAYVYILLYVADTKGDNFKGVYAGTEIITIDLRKSIPSTLLRPCAQHGWTVKRMGNDHDLSDGVVCIIRLTVDLVSQMMGDGLLVKQENFFPPPKYDLGYRTLLDREEPAPFGNPPPKNLRDLPSLFPFGTLQHYIEKE